MRMSSRSFTVLLSLIFACTVIVQATHENIFSVVDYGAKGNGESDDTSAIKATIAAAAANTSPSSRCTVLFPPGDYLSAAFNLSSHLILRIDHGATLVANNDPSVWPIIAQFPSHGVGRPKQGFTYAPFIGGFGVTNVHITGGGTIEGQGKRWWVEDRDTNTRPRLVEFQSSERLLISNVVLQNSPFWTLHLLYCDDVIVTNVNISAPFFSQNTDGIDVDSSSNVLISKCNIKCGDDNISIKSGFDKVGMLYGRPSTNITIVDSHLGPGQGISIGSESSGGVSNVLVSHVYFTLTTSAVYIKTARGRGGTTENVVFEHITMDKVLRPIYINMFYVKGREPDPETTPTVRNVIVRHVRGIGLQAGVFNCLPESPCQGLQLFDVDLITIFPFSWSNVERSLAVVVHPEIYFDRRLTGFSLGWYYVREFFNIFTLTLLLTLVAFVVALYKLVCGLRRRYFVKGGGKRILLQETTTTTTTATGGGTTTATTATFFRLPTEEIESDGDTSILVPEETVVSLGIVKRD